jgi:hypothetical protein
VEVYVQSIEGQTVVLKFYLQDLKELGEVKFTGKESVNLKMKNWLKIIT